jgi:hypothetical protein
MIDYYLASSTDLVLLAKYDEYLLNRKELNPGWLCKIGGSQDGINRHHNADQYNPLYFNRDNAIVFPGTFTDSRQAAWLELMLMQHAYDLGIGVNKNRNSPRNMATLTGEDYSSTNLGCIYLVPVHTYITTQDDFFEVHVSSHNKKKELIDAGDYQKGKHQNPELRQKQTPLQRKKQNPLQRKKPDQPVWARGRIVKSDAELQKEVQERFTKLGGVGIVSPQKTEDLCGNTTTFFSKNESAGVCIRGVNNAKCKRWKALPCHVRGGKRFREM